MDWHDAEVISEESGRPVFEIRGTVLAQADALGVQHVHVSLSHDAGHRLGDGGPRVVTEDASRPVRSTRSAASTSRCSGSSSSVSSVVVLLGSARVADVVGSRGGSTGVFAVGPYVGVACRRQAFQLTPGDFDLGSSLPLAARATSRWVGGGVGAVVATAAAGGGSRTTGG